jgi:hypothetical protein
MVMFQNSSSCNYIQRNYEKEYTGSNKLNNLELVKSRGRKTGHVVKSFMMINKLYKMFVCKTLRKETIRKPRSRWDNCIIFLTDVGCGVVDRILTA